MDTDDLLSYASFASMSYNNIITETDISEYGFPSSISSVLKISRIEVCETIKCEQMVEEQTDVVGWLFEDNVRSELICVFRGSDSIKDFVSNLHFLPVDFSVGMDYCGKVHKGFLDYYNKVKRAGVIELLLRKYRELKGATSGTVRLSFVGHSLGGVVVLCALEFFLAHGKEEGVHKDDVRCITFGAPALGDTQLRKSVLQHTPNIHRVVYAHDIVPRLPLYQHVADPIMIYDNDELHHKKGDNLWATTSRVGLLKCVEHHNMRWYIHGIRRGDFKIQNSIETRHKFRCRSMVI